MSQEILSVLDYWNLFVVISRCHLRDNWMHLFRFYCAFYLASHLLCECSIPLLFTALIRRFFDLTAGAANAEAGTGSTFLLCAWFGIPFCCHSDTSVHSMGRYRCLNRKSGCISMSSYVCWFLCDCNEYIRWNTKGNSCFWWLCPICLDMSYNITGRSWLLLQSSECIKILMCVFLIMYIVVTVVAATSDWRRRLWFIPEVPFETILFFLRPRERSSISTSNADISSEG